MMMAARKLYDTTSGAQIDKHWRDYCTIETESMIAIGATLYAADCHRNLRLPAESC